jgi:hypothetical protein
MRTTIRLDDQLLQQTKEYAARTGRTLTAVIEDALRELFARQKENDQKPPVKLTVVTGQGLQPGVDLDDSAALLELMDGSNGSS